MRIVIVLVALALLNGCMGYQTGKGLNALDSNKGSPFDSKSFWCTWDDCSKTSDGGDAGAAPDSSGPSDAVSGSDSGAGH